MGCALWEKKVRSEKGKSRSRRKTYPVLSVLIVRARHGRGGGSTRIGVRAARALTGLSLSVKSTDIFEQFAQHDLQSAVTPHAPIFNTGRPISFPATVGPFVGVVGEGRTEAVGTRFLSGLSTLTFSFAWVDSGALA
jgi:hypothetical protein